MRTDLDLARAQPHPPAGESPGRPLRILLLAHRIPHPLLDGYSLHTFNHAVELARRHELHLLCIDERPLPEAVSSVFRSARVVRPERRPRPSLLHRLSRALSIHEIFHVEPGLVEALRRQGSGFDVVWLAGVKMLQYAPYVRGVPALADLIDDEKGPALDALKMARGPVQLLRRLRNLANIVRFQRAMLGQVQTCTVVSEADRRSVRGQCPRLDVRVVPNGVDADHYAPMDLAEEPFSMAFEGNMSFPPNVDAMRFLVRRVLPRILREEPRARLTIVGRKPAPEVLALAGPAVTVTGAVDDVRPHLARAALFVSPMVSGTGIKNKILQAWAMGRPVLATTRSCGGLDVREGENIRVADGARGLARAAVELLRDQRRRQALGMAARGTVLRTFTWGHRSLQLEAVLEETARKARELPSA